MELKDKILARRTELGLSLDQVADRVGVSKTTIMRWENGDISNMRRDKINKLAQALQVSPAYLMGWTDEINGAIPDTLNMDDDFQVIHRAYQENWGEKEKIKFKELMKIAFDLKFNDENSDNN